MNSFILTTFLLTVGVCQVLSQDQFYDCKEPVCIQKGGMRIQNSECESFVPGDELCAAQKALGFECCYGLPKSEHRCRKRGGECFKHSYCAPKLLYREVSDCGAGEECCILV